MNKINLMINLASKSIFVPNSLGVFDSDRSILGEKVNFEKIRAKSKKKFLKLINKSHGK